MPFHPYFHGTPFIIIGTAGNMEIIPKLILTSKNVHSWLLTQTTNHNIDDNAAIFIARFPVMLWVVPIQLLL